MIKMTRALLSLALAITMLTALLPAGMVAFAVGEEDNTLSELGYVFNGAETLLTLTADDLYPTLQENRYVATLPQAAKLLPAEKLPQVFATTTNEEAKTAIANTTAFPGTAKIAVTAKNGAVRNYYIRFKYQAGAIVYDGTNSISATTYKKFDDYQLLTVPEFRAVALDVGSKWEQYNRLYVDDSGHKLTSPFVQTAKSAQRLPDTGDYLDPATSWYYWWFCKDLTSSVSSSPYFEGASWISPIISDTAHATSPEVPWFTLNTNRGATIWYINSLSTVSTTLTTANGWTASSDYTLRYGGVGTNTSFSRNYYKHFAAGEVAIPKYGVAQQRSPMIYIMWDAPGAGTTTLSSLTATVNGVPQPIAIVTDQTNYRVTVPAGSSVSLSAALTDPTGEMLVSQPDATTGIGTIYVASGTNTATYTIEVATLSSDTSLSTLTYSHPKLGVQSIALTDGVTDYNAVLPYGISSEIPQIVTATPNSATATVDSITQASALPGTASVAVKAGDGTSSVYNIHFSVNATPPVPDGLPGHITNEKTRHNSATAVYDTPQTNANLAVQQGSGSLPNTNYNTADYATATDKIAATLANNVYFTNDKSKWAYGDRDTFTDGTGTSSNPYFIHSQYAMVDGTSPVLLGDKVTKLLTLNSEKDVTIPVPDYYSFTIDKAATVYVVGNSSGYDTSYTGNGWTKETGMKAVRAATTKIMGDTDPYTDKYYMVPAGSSSSSNTYSKRYSAGANVTVPNKGIVTTNGIFVFVVWDECNTNTALSDIQVNGATLTGFTPNTATTSFNVVLPYNTTGVPTLTATPSFNGASVEITNPSSLPGAATIHVLAADGVTTQSYSINYTIETLPAPALAADDLGNTIIGLDLATMEYAVSTDDGTTYGSYTTAPAAFGGALKVKVRYAATQTTPASLDIVFAFTINSGDISGDGVIDISDVIMAAEIAVGSTAYSTEQIARANVSDKAVAVVDISDVVLIAERAVGGTAVFPVDQTTAPTVILKLDDLRSTNYTAFQQIADIIYQEDIKVSFGVIGNSLEDDGQKQAYYDTIKGWVADDIEIWHHGYSHTEGEYNAASYADQKTSFQKTVDLLAQKCDYTVHTFGSPYNNSDATTVQVLNNEFPQIKVSLLAADPNSEATQLQLNTRCNMEVSAGALDFSYFVQNYNNTASSPYLVLQGHPASWDANEIIAFKNIIAFLKSKGAAFVTPYEYYGLVQPVV